MITLVTSDPNEPVSRSLRLLAKDDLRLVTLEDLLQKATIHDTLIDGKARVQWTFPDNSRVTNEPGNMLVNRVLGVAPALFDGFVPEDRFYARREFEAYLGFALNAFESRTRSAPNGMGGIAFSRPEQWECLRSQKLEIAVPEYAWGCMAEAEFTGDNIVQSSIYDFGDWQAGRHKALPELGQPPFLFRRPPGDPVFAGLLAGTLLVSDREGFVHRLEPDVRDRIYRATEFMAKSVGSDFCEALYFVHEKLVTFGFCAPQLSITPKNPDFSETMFKAMSALKERARISS